VIYNIFDKKPLKIPISSFVRQLDLAVELQKGSLCMKGNLQQGKQSPKRETNFPEGDWKKGTVFCPGIKFNSKVRKKGARSKN